MADIDEILDDLNGARFESALTATTLLAAAEFARFNAETRNPNGMPRHPYFGQPGHYPAARLLQAYALAGLGRYADAQAVIDDEITRLHQHAHHRAEALLALHIGLSAMISTEMENLAKGMECYEQLIEQVAAQAAKRLGNFPIATHSAHYLRADLRDTVSFVFRSSSVSELAGMPFPAQLGHLNEHDYCVKLQISGGDYYMPRMTRTAHRQLQLVA